VSAEEGTLGSTPANGRMAVVSTAACAISLSLSARSHSFISSHSPLQGSKAKEWAVAPSWPAHNACVSALLAPTTNE
jgi:hypothetical protein